MRVVRSDYWLRIRAFQYISTSRSTLANMDLKVKCGSSLKDHRHPVPLPAHPLPEDCTTLHATRQHRGIYIAQTRHEPACTKRINHTQGTAEAAFPTKTTEIND
jgi:hypothetical protein